MVWYRILRVNTQLNIDPSYLYGSTTDDVDVLQAWRLYSPDVLWAQTRDQLVSGNQSTFHDASLFFKSLSFCHSFLILPVQLRQLWLKRVDLLVDFVQISFGLVVGALQSCHLRQNTLGSVRMLLCSKKDRTLLVWKMLIVYQSVISEKCNQKLMSVLHFSSGVAAQSVNHK